MLPSLWSQRQQFCWFQQTPTPSAHGVKSVQNHYFYVYYYSFSSWFQLSNDFNQNFANNNFARISNIIWIINACWESWLKLQKYEWQSFYVVDSLWISNHGHTQLTSSSELKFKIWEIKWKAYACMSVAKGTTWTTVIISCMWDLEFTPRT